MAEQEQPQAEKYGDLKRNRDFWKDQFSKSEQEKLQLGAEIQKLANALVEAKDKADAGALLAEELVLARRMLRELAEHVSGRNGMLAKSKTFCGVCQNPVFCPIGKVWKALDPAEEAAA